MVTRPPRQTRFRSQWHASSAIGGLLNAMTVLKFTLSTLAALACSTGGAFARDNLQIAGSSTVLPYATIVAELFAENSGFAAPVVEGGGSGAGRKKLCEGLGEGTIDIANSSSRIKQSDIDDCTANGVTEIMEVRFGYDGIAVFGRYRTTTDSAMLGYNTLDDFGAHNHDAIGYHYHAHTVSNHVSTDAMGATSTADMYPLMKGAYVGTTNRGAVFDCASKDSTTYAVAVPQLAFHRKRTFIKRGTFLKRHEK